MNERPLELKNFNLQCFLDSANELVRHDEVERALTLLNNLPAYYREHQPKEIAALRNEILSRIATPSDYSSYEEELELDVNDDSQMAKTLRGTLVINEVTELNKNGYIPHIIDYAAGNFYILFILLKNNLKFTYNPRPINKSGLKKLTDSPYAYLLTEPPTDQPHVFLALEIIEHLSNQWDLKTEALKLRRMPDIIHVSTPRYTFDVDCDDWTTRECLGHLRAYTPMEFKRILSEMFIEYKIEVISSTIMHARLILTK